jgi:hypothetical protein
LLAFVFAKADPLFNKKNEPSIVSPNNWMMRLLPQERIGAIFRDPFNAAEYAASLLTDAYPLVLPEAIIGSAQAMSGVCYESEIILGGYFLKNTNRNME